MLDFNKQQKGTGIKILSTKQMLQKNKKHQVLHLKTYQVKSDKPYIHIFDQKKLLKKYITI